MRRFLDGLYAGAGALAAVCLVILLCIIVAQMVARWSGVSFPGSTAYAGYFMASVSFLAFAYALNANAHIRVNLLLNALGKHKYWAELWCFIIGSVATCWMAWYAVAFTWESYVLHDISQGRDKMQLWIPQVPMAIGSCLLALSFVDNLVTLVLTGKTNVDGSKYTQQEI